MVSYGSQSNKGQPDGKVFTGVIDKVHQEIHEGNFITLNYLALAVANNGYARLKVKTGAKSFHFTAYVDVEAKCYLKTYVGTTYTAQGTLPDNINLTVFNRRTNSALVPTTEFRYNPTINAIGTIRGNRMFPGGTGGNSVGLSGGERVESVIAPNTEFLLELQNVSGQTKDIGIIVEGYEE